MSWGFTVQVVPKAQFDKAVDDAVPTGQDPDLPGMAADVAQAKFAMKALGQHVKRPNVGGSAGGHCLQEGEGLVMSDSLSVNVYGAGE